MTTVDHSGERPEAEEAKKKNKKNKNKKKPQKWYHVESEKQSTDSSSMYLPALERVYKR